MSTFAKPTGGDGFNVVSPADFNDWRQQTHGFQDMAAWRDYGFDLTGEHAGTAGGSAGCGRLLEPFFRSGDSSRLWAATFTSGGGQAGRQPRGSARRGVFFKDALRGDPSIIGKQIRLDSAPYEIIGVLPRWFTYPDARVQLWVPYASTFDAKSFARHDMHQSHVVARLKPGVSASAAMNEVSALQYQIHLAQCIGAGRGRGSPAADDRGCGAGCEDTAGCVCCAPSDACC